ncbi:uncharacterized protein A4U43_C07F7400 [Asparagus officinalis]|uniref:Import inner membrane translocase subunit n=1 Tax=Asparagus officinalis TaxID=4686 RepID=A0A5P1EF80_ASPOF|nr:uncharacterized protein LOC109848514 [Asparagus officinalis]ONK62720.1 uncharacterized protein A4U43_C07F7400 [Asparagus officinalis]
MAKSSKQIVSGFQRLYLHRIPSKPNPPIPNPSPLYRRAYSTEFLPKPTSQNGIFSRILSQNHKFSTPKPFSPSGFSNSRQLVSIRNFTAGSGKSIVKDPLSKIKTGILQYREALGLQVESFWKRNYLVLVGAGGVVVCIALWRVMFGVASTFVGLSEGMAKYGFLALAAAMVSFGGMYIRSRLSINPDKIYRIAMRKLNTSAGILEVMGAPLTGTDLRAYVMSGGGPKLKNFKFKLGGKRCFLIFPIRGSERKGLVSVEAKKKKGQYDIKLLAVDIPMLQGPDQRIFIIGDEEEYKIGGGLISELRDPIVKAMAAEKEFEDLDQKEEEEDEEREREEAERKHQQEREEAIGEEKEVSMSLGTWRRKIMKW